jgi:hypothetical protein
MHRSKHPITIRMAPIAELTPDHSYILPGMGVWVDRTGGTFGEVLGGEQFQYRRTPVFVSEDLGAPRKEVVCAQRVDWRHVVEREVFHVTNRTLRKLGCGTQLRS